MRSTGRSIRRCRGHSFTLPHSVKTALQCGLHWRLLEVLEKEELGQGSMEAGKYLQARLAEALADFAMVKEVRGVGLLMGIEFQPPRQLHLRVPYQGFAAVHPAMSGQIVVMRLFRDSGFLTQICGNNFMVLKVAPPLVVTDAQLDACGRFTTW